MDEKLNGMMEDMEEMRAHICVLNRALVNGGSSVGTESKKVKAREPKPFIGVRDPKLTEFERKNGDVALKTNKSGAKDQKPYEKKKFEKGKTSTREEKGPKNGEKKKNGQENGKSKKLRCFICGEEHNTRDCPKKKLLNSIKEEGETNYGDEEQRMG
ncbi:hypothetical protein H6P81_002647 [Aristolochia fimbriata]|uniref:CCHC-type domain-containing protein n=1 Tax=Aristolochia fimbriata TaxID=158543 RepID=A0AAV7FC47_ARIFI|nr:hypothetical protein H6P81_002647 [Aristolochia fimbriata]